MSAIDYGVNFNLNVNAEAAIQTVNKFKSALTSLTKTKNNPIQDLLRQARSLNDTLAGLSRKPVNLDTSAASRKLDLLNKQAKSLTRHLNSARNIKIDAAAINAQREAATARQALSASQAASGKAALNALKNFFAKSNPLGQTQGSVDTINKALSGMTANIHIEEALGQLTILEKKVADIRAGLNMTANITGVAGTNSKKSSQSKDSGKPMAVAGSSAKDSGGDKVKAAASPANASVISNNQSKASSVKANNLSRNPADWSTTVGWATGFSNKVAPLNYRAYTSLQKYGAIPGILGHVSLDDYRAMVDNVVRSANRMRYLPKVAEMKADAAAYQKFLETRANGPGGVPSYYKYVQNPLYYKSPSEIATLPKLPPLFQQQAPATPLATVPSNIQSFAASCKAMMDTFNSNLNTNGVRIDITQAQAKLGELIGMAQEFKAIVSAPATIPGPLAPGMPATTTTANTMPPIARNAHIGGTNVGWLPANHPDYRLYNQWRTQLGEESQLYDDEVRRYNQSRYTRSEARQEARARIDARRAAAAEQNRLNRWLAGATGPVSQQDLNNYARVSGRGMMFMAPNHPLRGVTPQIAGWFPASHPLAGMYRAYTNGTLPHSVWNQVNEELKAYNNGLRVTAAQQAKVHKAEYERRQALNAHNDRNFQRELRYVRGSTMPYRDQYGNQIFSPIMHSAGRFMDSGYGANRIQVDKQGWAMTQKMRVDEAAASMTRWNKYMRSLSQTTLNAYSKYYGLFRKPPIPWSDFKMLQSVNHPMARMRMVPPPPPEPKPMPAYPAANPPKAAVSSSASSGNGNLNYKLLGPSPLTNNGGMAVSMLKGMGIGYGIAGIGQLASNIIKESAEYDNLMKTVENILKSHDMSSNFNQKFQQMTATIRNVGMETKYKTTEVADAAKFLAMAGLDVEAINKAMRPVADIALIGDTDLGQTADMVTNVMTAYNLQPGQMRRAADIMTNTFTMSNTTLTDIAEAYKYSASLLSASDVNFGESAAAIGVLGDAGIKGSQAGTTLRTILANILNPTKKQKKAWDSIGVNTDGKSLVQIFQELNAKDLDAGKFYQLFHKTAAAGAVALASHVDKWNEIIAENFLSDGMSSRLADEKKNTIQGLWAQLTSVFTDDGIQAFGGIQEPIRQAMKGAIEFLKSDEAKSKFMAFFAHLKEFGKILKEVTGWFYWIYDKAWRFIEPLIKIQMYLWPITKTFRMLTTGVNVAKWFMSAASSITLFTGRLAGATAANKMFASSLVESSGVQNSTMATNGGFIGALKDKHSNFRKEWRQSKWKALKSVGNTGIARNGVGIGMMALGMKELVRDDGNGWDNAAGAFYGVGGLAAMLGGPVGWTVAGVGLLGGIVTQYWANVKRAEEATQKLYDTAKKYKVVDGIAVNSDNPTLRYLDLIYSKNKSINEVIEKRIQLEKERMGLAPSTAEHDMKAEIAEILKGWDDNSQNSSLAKLIETGAAVLSVTDGLSSKFEGMKRHKTSGKIYALREGEGGADILRYWADKKNNKYFDYAVDGSPRNVGDIKKIYSNQLAAFQVWYTTKMEKEMLNIQENVQRRASHNISPEDWSTFFSNQLDKYDPSRRSDLTTPDAYTKEHLNPDKWVRGEGGFFDIDYVIQSWISAIMLPKILQYQEDVKKYIEAKKSGRFDDESMLAMIGLYNPSLKSALAAFSSGDLAFTESTLGLWGDTFHEYKGMDAYGHAELALQYSEGILRAIQLYNKEGLEGAEGFTALAEDLAMRAKMFLGEGEEIVGTIDGEIRKFGDLTVKWMADYGLWAKCTADGSFAMDGVTSGFNSLTSTLTGLSEYLANTDWKGLWKRVLPTLPGQDPVSSFLGGTVNQNSAEDFGLKTQAARQDFKQNMAVMFDMMDIKMGKSPTDVMLNNLTGPRAGYGLFSGDKAAARSSSISWMRAELSTPNLSYFSKHYTPNTSLFSGQQIGNLNAFNKKNGLDGDHDNDGLNTNLNTNDYKSRYQNNAAAPKQVIVNIDSLLTVEHVDMADPKKAETVYNLKKDLSQALIDVVHEFDATWHG